MIDTFSAYPASPVVLPSELAFPTPCHDGFAGLTLAQRATRTEILHRAYSIWESKGRLENHQLTDWCEAEAEVLAEVAIATGR